MHRRLLNACSIRRSCCIAICLGMLLRASISAAGVAEPKTEQDSSASTSQTITFEKHVRPILKAHCFQCHGEEADPKAGLDLRLVRLMTDGGESGPAIAPGDAAESLLWSRVSADEMPEGPKKLSPADKQILRDWIEQGARTARAEPSDPADARYTHEELSFWAFQPVRVQPPPQHSGGKAPVSTRPVPRSIVENPVDAYIVQQLQVNGLQFSPPADRRTWLRRVTMDLVGVPPTPAEVNAFVADDSPEASARVVDRLLSSPQYGVRWARHWLDVAGYAESDGVQGNDRPRPHAWHYRDYVVAAMNKDKPYDQFLVEQLAGDELLHEELLREPSRRAQSLTESGSKNPSLVPDKNNPRHRELLAATGFLRMAPDTTDAEDTVLTRNQAVAETIKLVGSAVLGLTIGCAQCHDHRYDPVSIEDYYSFRAIFDPAFPLEHWQKPSQRLVDLTSDETQRERDQIEAQAAEIEADIRARRRAHCQSIQDREIAKAPLELQAAIREAVDTPAGKQTDEQKRLLDLHPTVRTIDWIVGQLVEYDNPTYRKFEAEEKKVADLRATKPLAHLVMTVSENPAHVPTSAVMFRGDPAQAARTVQPAELYVLQQHRYERPANDPANSTNSPNPLPSSGRRLAYARWLTDGSHPLVARVLVNRVWMHHFGRGLVSTPGDFGFFGDRPSHPELLDYLADALVRNGWSIKWLHRQLVLSRTYAQTSQLTDELAVQDPDNRWWARMNLRRAEAEVVRDSLLAVSGAIEYGLQGPSVPVDENAEGKAVIGKRAIRDGLRADLLGGGSAAHRRSLFVSVKRDLPLNVLETFDLPTMNPNCHLRMESAGTPQALWFLNDETIVELAQQMATNLLALPNADLELRLREAFAQLYSSEITAAEIVACRDYLAEQTERFRAQTDEAWQKQVQDDPRALDVRTWASLCQMLMASNRFLYIE